MLSLKSPVSGEPVDTDSSPFKCYRWFLCKTGLFCYCCCGSGRAWHVPLCPPVSPRVPQGPPVSPSAPGWPAGWGCWALGWTQAPAEGECRGAGSPPVSQVALAKGAPCPAVPLAALSWHTDPPREGTTHQPWLDSGQGPVEPGQAVAPALAGVQPHGSHDARRGQAELSVLDQPQPRVVELLVLWGDSRRRHGSVWLGQPQPLWAPVPGLHHPPSQEFLPSIFCCTFPH